MSDRPSERINGDVCGLSRRWLIEPALARMLVALEDVAARSMAAEGVRWPGAYIISGYRTATEQEAVNPSEPLSLHRRCPALAVDLRVGDTPASLTPFDTWGELGAIWKNLGGGWGGDFAVPDLNHFFIAGEPTE